MAIPLRLSARRRFRDSPSRLRRFLWPEACVVSGIAPEPVQASVAKIEINGMGDEARRVTSSTEEAPEPEKRTQFEQMGGASALKELLRYFYADVRQDEVLGPIFNARIQDWPAHLDKIGSFWARQLGAPSNYAGGFGAVHLSLGLQEEHFHRWLGLWERNCRQHLDPAAANWMIERAQEIGRNLRRIVGGAAGLQIGR